MIARFTGLYVQQRCGVNTHGRGTHPRRSCHRSRYLRRRNSWRLCNDCCSDICDDRQSMNGRL